MHSLTCLKNLFESNSVEVKAFNGMFMLTEHGRWGMAGGEYYIDSKMISKSDIKKLIGVKK